MKKTILLYSLAVAGGVFLLQWLEYQHMVRVLPTEIYVGIVAVLFGGLGVWVGSRLTATTPPQPFEPNVRAIEYLGISGREYDVLELLALGHSNREIADELFVSPNTVKSHLARLYDKLEVSRRTQAIQKARTLRMIP